MSNYHVEPADKPKALTKEALKAVRHHLGQVPFDPDTPMLDPLLSEAEGEFADLALTPAQQLRLLARYGSESAPIFAAATQQELQTISDTPYSWAELRQAARAEGVVHLDDLLLRRVRLGLLAPNGGLDLLERIRAIVQPELGWEDARWVEEAKSYAELWQSAYRL